MTRGYLALGSNLGDKRANLETAVRALGRSAGIAVRKVAPICRTAAIGPVRQDEFLNTVVEIETSFTPVELLDRCLGIEQAMGRVRRERQGPRPIDIDIVWLEGISFDTPRLIVPHPEAHRRRFVLVPLRQIAPKLELAGHSIEHWLPGSQPEEIEAVERGSLST